MKINKHLCILALLLCILKLDAFALDNPYVNSVYTNELITKEAAMKRPIAVMIPTDEEAQPSYGISEAKILYEIMEEGNISRQMAIIDNWDTLGKIGNIRSTRLYYLQTATEWDPILVHFGGVFYMKDRIEKGDINNISGTFDYGTGGEMRGTEEFFRSPYKPAPHNAYISSEGIIRTCEKYNYSLTIRPEYYNDKHFNFSSSINNLEQYPEAVKAEKINLADIFPYSKSSFIYNEEQGVYYKSLHGMPQTDGYTKERISFTNIIIQSTSWGIYENSNYLYFNLIDDTQTGWYITKGKCIPITWKKTSDYSPTLYYDMNGNEIEMNTGKTYIAIAQNEKVPEIK